MASTETAGATRPHIFIQTNSKQSIGAIVSAYSMKRNSAHADEFDVTIMQQEDYPFFAKREGQTYMRHGVKRTWHENDLQSFTLTRFLPPQLMGYQGRALVVDPDVFAVQDVWELLSRDMQGKAIMCRGSKFKNGAFASSVMLLDCAKLTHWDVEKGFNELFEGKRDYHNWISLLMEDRNTIGTFEDEWNDFDKLTPEDQDDPQHPPPHPAVEDRPQGGLHADRIRAGHRLDHAHAPQVVRRSCAARPLCPPPGPQPGSISSSASCKEAYEKGLVTDAQIKEAMSKNYHPPRFLSR